MFRVAEPLLAREATGRSAWPASVPYDLVADGRAPQAGLYGAGP